MDGCPLDGGTMDDGSKWNPGQLPSKGACLFFKKKENKIKIKIK